jgi:hypothetical protein
MTEPFKRVVRITRFTHDIRELWDADRNSTGSSDAGADLQLPVLGRTATVYDDDGIGSTVLREIVGREGQVEKNAVSVLEA